MFERVEEMLKNQPDWLEVSFPAGTLDAVNERLSSIGATAEQVVRNYVMRLLEVEPHDIPKICACGSCENIKENTHEG